MSTGQGILGNNMFAYCGNNPVNNFDPSGCGWIKNLVNGCKKFVKSIYNYCSNAIESITPKTNGYKSSQGGQTTKSGSGSSISTPEVPIRDVTYEVNCALKPYVHQAQQMRKLANTMPLYEPYIYGTFGTLVNHGAAWDIKQKNYGKKPYIRLIPVVIKLR